MPRSVDLFIACPDSLDGVAEAIGALAALEVSPDGPGRWLVKDGDVQAALGEHTRADDTELLLSRYRFALSAEVPDGIRPQDTSAAAMLREVAQMLQARPEWMTLMVLDMQYRGRSLSDAGDGGAAPAPDATAAKEVPA